jgi:hypothetical protein
MSDAARQIDLLGTVDVLHRHLTEALCRKVFDEVRKGERKRTWPLHVLAEFWTAVILRAPPSLTHALSEAAGGHSLYPQTTGSDQGFFERCQTLSWEFFAALFKEFSDVVAREEPAPFASAHAAVIRRFGHVYALDGSTLDQVARRLKILWNDRRVPLPGSVVALYDLARGCPARLDFERCPTGKEQFGARRVLADLPAGSLCVADALCGLPHFFGTLAEREAYGIARRSHRARMVTQRRLSRRNVAGGRLEERIVQIGTSGSSEPQIVRWIRWRKGSKSIELVTNVLDPAMLSAEEALALYRARWGIERLFYDLKEVLNLHRFYAANVNAVAMQVYACAIVYTAFRAAQGRIAVAVGIAPEMISTEKLFPKVAAASASLTTAELAFDAVCEANPGARLVKPDWRRMPFATVSLDRVLVQKRTGQRKKRRGKPTHRRRRLPRPPPRPR